MKITDKQIAEFFDVTPKTLQNYKKIENSQKWHLYKAMRLYYSINGVKQE